MKVTQLKKRARAAGVDPAMVDATDDAADTREELTDLIIARQMRAPPGPDDLPPRSQADPRTDPTAATDNMPPAGAIDPPLTSGAEQYDTWKAWEGMYTAADSAGIEMLYAKDFAKPAFYLRESGKVWVVLYHAPAARGCERMAQMYKELAGMFQRDTRVRFRVVNLAVTGDPSVPPSPEAISAQGVGISRPGAIQIFHLRATDYAAGVKVPIWPGPYTANALRREILRETGEPVAWQDLMAVLSMPAIYLGGATVLLTWLLYKGVTWAAASAETLVAERTAPETEAQVWTPLSSVVVSVSLTCPRHESEDKTSQAVSLK